jgi:hypothetical protein
METIYHIAASAEEVKNLIRANGAKTVLLNWTRSDDDALDAIDENTRGGVSHYVIDSDCDNRSESGKCLGHPRK